MGAPKPTPPPLPRRADPQPQPLDRTPSVASVNSAATPPPQYQAVDEPDLRWLSTDPRASSTQSLVPSVSDSESRRTLLVVYIHGFYGNDQSFRSFPAHVHAVLRNLLYESHVIHSKVYPRYKTYKAIEVATDKFSTWLEPHESPTTDVILIGHSMGGLLAADVVLKPNHNPQLQRQFKHRILGTISLDSPFLGLHPGIVVSGISSLFQPAASPQDEGLAASPPPVSSSASFDDAPSMNSSLQTPSVSSLATSGIPDRQPNDPHFDPPFFNDEPFREQPFVKRLMHFAAKHKSEGILNAVGNHLLSHLEFGGCLADYPALSARYKRLRALEDVDELQNLASGGSGAAHTRVRFVNYYTLSPGRPKPPKEPPKKNDDPSQTDLSTADLAPHGSSSRVDVGDEQRLQPGSDVSTPRISIEDPDGKNRLAQEASSLKEKTDGQPSTDSNVDTGAETPPDLNRLSMVDLEPTPMEEVDPTPIEEDPPVSGSAAQPLSKSVTQSLSETQSQSQSQLQPEANLPPIPDAPPKPELPDLEQYTDKDSRKQAEKESKRLQKAYERAVKDREKALREREKLLEKRRKRAEKDASKLDKEALKEQQRLDKEEKKRLVREELTTKHTDDVRRNVEDGKAPDAAKAKKLKKFCTVPSKVNGKMDPTWVDVYIDGVDEVGAHCGLFFVGPHYDSFVGDVGSRILGWVQEDMSKRALMAVD